MTHTGDGQVYPPALDEKFRLGMERHRAFVSSIQAMEGQEEIGPSEVS